MLFSFYGVVKMIYHGHLILSISNVEYEILVSHIEDFSINEEVKLFLYEVKRSDEDYLIGFKTLDEKEAFLSLIKVKGIGPKSALVALGNISPVLLFKAINDGDVDRLKRIKGIGPKGAAQIILDLKGKLQSDALLLEDNENFIEAQKALSVLGFKNNQIEESLKGIDRNIATSEEIIALALRNMNKVNGKTIR